jgi:hypothetical protein
MKEKICPRCQTKHKKRGPYCSRSCGNVRVHSEQDKKIRSEKLNAYYQTPEGAATRAKQSSVLTKINLGLESTHVSQEEFAVDIPSIPTLDDYEDLLDGFDQASDW